jgi:release factor glutamine methyltransferase
VTRAGTRLDAALAWARRQGIASLDAQRLACAVLGRERTWVLAHGEHLLGDDERDRFEALCARRAAAEPLAYLLGEKEFYGLLLAVDRHVLVPRPETEVLVDWALELLAAGPAAPAVADLGTGSGAIALAIASACPDAQVCATDLSPDALARAAGNGVQLGIEVEWRQGDWWSAVAGRQFHLATSNPPYVAEADPHLRALTHEPRLALTPGGDGLDALRAVASGAPAHLQRGGWLLLEHGQDQAEAVQALLRRAGLADIATREDLAGRPRCTAGRLVSRP